MARYTMLAEPTWPVYAVDSRRWKAATGTGVEILPEPVEGACEWELRQYSPALVPDGATVDPLSLTLSLEEEPDQRVQLALAELKERFPW